MGNIASRSDIAGGAAWTYDPVKKHAVTQAGSSSYTYTYDNNGNAITRNGDAITWTSFNYPLEIISSGTSETFEYGPERQRWKSVYVASIGTETTYHVGKLLEKVINGSTDYRHYIYAGNELVAIYSRKGSTNTLRYVLEDHQASYASILSDTAALDVRESFAAYGARRDGNTWVGAPSNTDETTINGISRRGYIGETVLGVTMGLTDLNGRVQDAITGRFLSPDPIGQSIGNTQSWNRYSYVVNNPLTRVDPTGFDDVAELPYHAPDEQATGLDEIVVEGTRIKDPQFGSSNGGAGLSAGGSGGGSSDGGGSGGGGKTPAQTNKPVADPTPAQRKVMNAAASGGNTFVNTLTGVTSTGGPITVVVVVDANGIVSSYTYYDTVTGDPDYNFGGASMNATTNGGQTLGQFLAAYPDIAGTKWANPYKSSN